MNGHTVPSWPTSTPERLPKPIDEMTDDEVWATLPVPKPCRGHVVGQTALGPIIHVSPEVAAELERLAQSGRSDAASDEA